MARTRWPAMNVTLFGTAAKFFPARSARDFALSRGQRLENGIEPLHRLVGPANHHAITTLKAPPPATGSHIHVVNAGALELFRAAHVIFEIRVAAVDDDVAGLHILSERLNRLLRGAARWNHDPYCTRRLQFADQIFQRR